jgi:hypothetical protein
VRFFGFFFFGFFAPFVLCCGGLFATTSTARSKRCQASWVNSGCFVELVLSFMAINPALDQFPTEALAIGKMVASFGEIELLFGLLAGSAPPKPEFGT